MTKNVVYLITHLMMPSYCAKLYYCMRYLACRSKTNKPHCKKVGKYSNKENKNVICEYPDEDYAIGWEYCSTLYVYPEIVPNIVDVCDMENQNEHFVPRPKYRRTPSILFEKSVNDDDVYIKIYEPPPQPYSKQVCCIDLCINVVLFAISSMGIFMLCSMLL